LRARKDLDIVPAPGQENLERPAAVLRALDARGYDDLVTLKRDAGRQGDLEDLERLREVRGE